jgi:hypothetical protein
MFAKTKLGYSLSNSGITSRDSDNFCQEKKSGWIDIFKSTRMMFSKIQQISKLIRAAKM